MIGFRKDFKNGWWFDLGPLSVAYMNYKGGGVRKYLQFRWTTEKELRFKHKRIGPFIFVKNARYAVETNSKNDFAFWFMIIL